MSDNITGDLDLLGDWLDAKGYTEEAGLCTRAMDEINKLREERHELKNEMAKWVNYWRDKDVKALSAENEKLRAALAAERERCAKIASGLCESCGGEGWLWAHELGIGLRNDDTKYSCDGQGESIACKIAAAIRSEK
jgi:hypothetical protein